MDIATKGSLRGNLYSVAHMEWKEKLKLLICIASDLQIIHSLNLIHRDLHSGNILQDNLYSAYIADLGLSTSTDVALKEESGGVCGILPYVAPEVLCGKSYTLKSDIYSFGIIMWEISSGKAVPFDNPSCSSRLEYQIQVCFNNKRPPIIEGTPQCYIDLMKRCWDKSPENRLSAEKIYEVFTEWQNDKILENIENIQNAENVQNAENTHSEIIYKSEFIPCTKLSGKVNNT